MKSVAYAVLLLAALMWTALASAQTAAPAPPPMSSDSKPKPSNGKSTKPRQSIILSPSDRQAIDARELKAVKPANVEEALQPTPEDAKVERVEDLSNTTRIEQQRTSNRISEVIVTPRGAPYSYSMTNREGRQPFGVTQMTPGLSVPNFFRFEFGRSVPPPDAAPPPSQSKPAN